MRTNGLVDPPRLYLWKHADHRFYDFVRIVGPLTRQDGLKYRFSELEPAALGSSLAALKAASALLRLKRATRSLARPRAALTEIDHEPRSVVLVPLNVECFDLVGH